MQKAQVQALGQDNPLEKKTATPVFLPGNPMDRGAWRAAVHVVAKTLAAKKNNIVYVLTKL